MSGVWEWLLAPLSGQPHAALEPWAYWHARCMVLAWGLLIPAGALTARYFKVLPGQDWPRVLDNKTWWHAHRGLQWAGLGLTALGLWLAWGHGPRQTLTAQAHAWAGLAMVALGLVQALGGLTRGSKGGPTEPQRQGDHYDMTPHRRRFERLHKGAGWMAVLASVGVIALGLQAADAPRWMPLALAAWWLALGLAAWRWQHQGRCVDTYQAIWGPDPRHPGNRVAPIGWGVHRPFAAKASPWPSLKQTTHSTGD